MNIHDIADSINNELYNTSDIDTINIIITAIEDAINNEQEYTEDIDIRTAESLRKNVGCYNITCNDIDVVMCSSSSVDNNYLLDKQFYREDKLKQLLNET